MPELFIGQAFGPVAHGFGLSNADQQMTAYEKDLLYMLCSGDTVTAMSKYTGEYFTGAVDEVAALQGKFWIYAELGERKLIDLDEHTICKIN